MRAVRGARFRTLAMLLSTSGAACDVGALAIYDGGGAPDSTILAQDGSAGKDAGRLDASEADRGVDAGGPSTCGDGVVEADEQCDGELDSSCLEYGYRTGDGTGVTCTSTCTVRRDCRGGAIDDPEQLRSALAEALVLPGPQVISLWPGTYELGDHIGVDECIAGCSSPPAGVTIQPLSGVVEVRLDPLSSDGIAFQLASDNIVIKDLRFVDVPIAVKILASAKHCTVLGNDIAYSTVKATGAIDSEGPDARIIANRIIGALSDEGSVAIFVRSSSAAIAMNVIRGGLDEGIDIDAPVAGTKVDHNSIWLDDSNGTLLYLRDPVGAGICFRNNVLLGNATTTTGLDVHGDVSFTACGGAPAGKNAVVDQAIPCSGLAAKCTLFCLSGGPACDLRTRPGFADDDLCLMPGTNELIDAALDTGWDLVDGDAALFLGLAPDVGAREAASTRAFGNVPTTCP